LGWNGLKEGDGARSVIMVFHTRQARLSWESSTILCFQTPGYLAASSFRRWQEICSVHYCLLISAK